ncbi:MAG: polysaccharide biosynthesis C-terminal domain-containing protein [Bacteroidales bacterium]|nr:polysaccharide biosynthesis C-terminal domain-containing protein [Bacteroidales bacterium]
MLDKLKYTFKHTAIYSLGNLGAKVMGLLLLPLYTTYLTTAEYGILSILEITSQFAVAVIGLNLASGMMRWTAQERDAAKSRSIVFTTYVSVFLLIVAFNIIVFPFSKNLSELFFDHPNYYQYFQILWLWTSFEIMNQVTTNLIRIRDKSLLFIVLFLSKLLIILVLNIYFIVSLEMGVKGIILSQLIGNALYFLATIPFILKNINFKFDLKIQKEITRYSFPLIFSTISMMVLTMSDRYMIKFLMDSDSDVGIYTLGYKIASVINLFLIQSFRMGFVPIAYKMYDKKGAKRYFSKITTYFGFILILFALLITLFSKEVIIIFSPANKDFWIAYKIVPLIAFIFFLRGINQMVSLSLHFVKRTKYNARIVMTSALFNIGLNFFLVPILGIYGAALSTLISTALMLGLFYNFSQKFYTINYEKKRLLKILLAGSSLFALSLLTENLNIWIGAMIKIFLLGLFPIILWFIKFFEPVEIERIKGAWMKWKNPLHWKTNLKEIKFK